MALRKKFGKQYYDFDSTYHNEARAYAQAKKLREAGNKARVKKTSALTWEVWVR